MARYLSLLFLISTLGACGGPEASVTPEGTVRTVLQLLRDRDFEDIVSLVHPDEQAKAESEFEQITRDDPDWHQKMKREFDLDEEDLAGLSVREAWALVATRAAEKHKEAFEKLLSAEIGKIRIDGDEARVRLRMGDGRESIRLLRHEGRWFLRKPPEW